MRLILICKRKAKAIQTISPQIPVCIVATIINDKLTLSKQFIE